MRGWRLCLRMHPSRLDLNCMAALRGKWMSDSSGRLQGMDAAICWPNLFSCKIYCSDLECCEQTDKALSLIFLHININFTVRGGLLNSKCEHEALELRTRGLGTQVAFSSMLQVRGKGLRCREGWEVSAGQQLAPPFVVVTGVGYDQGTLTGDQESRVKKR